MHGFYQILRRPSFTLLFMPRIVTLPDFYGFLIHLIPVVSLTYRFCMVLFGSLHVVYHQLPQHNQYPCLHVNNIVTEFNMEEEPLQFYSQARSILLAAKFNLITWAFNSRKLWTLHGGMALQTTMSWDNNGTLPFVCYPYIFVKGLNHTTTPLTTK